MKIPSTPIKTAPLGQITVYLFLVLAAVSTSSAAQNMTESDASDRDALTQLEAHIESHSSSLDRSTPSLKEHYLELAPTIFSENRIQTAPPAYLDRAFTAAHDASFYLRDDTALEDMENTLTVITSRGIDTENHYADLFKIYVTLRQFGNAEALRNQPNAPEFYPLPKTEDPLGKDHNQPSHWVISPEEKKLTREAFAMAETPGIIMVAHPMCRFSNDAVSAMLSEPIVGDVIRDNIQLIAPQTSLRNFDRLQSWNLDEQLPEISLVHHIHAWAGFDSWDTPSIYFLDRGEIIDHVVGWPDDSRMDEVKLNLQRIGLLSSDKD